MTPTATKARSEHKKMKRFDKLLKQRHSIGEAIPEPEHESMVKNEVRSNTQKQTSVNPSESIATGEQDINPSVTDGA